MPLPPRALIAMIHIQALPGAPMSRLSVDDIVAQAAAEAHILAQAGFDAIIIENMHDRPYIHGNHGPETVAIMTRIAIAVREHARRAGEPLPLGVQILSGGNTEALAIALAAGAQFIRCENFVFAHIADEGILARAEAGPLLRYRKQIGADHIRIFTDIRKKHACHAITADLTIADMAEAAEFFASDGLIVTGDATGKPTSIEDVKAAARAIDHRLPILIGSGVTPRTAATLLEHADALIVGSWIKEGGIWRNPPDPRRCQELVAAARRSDAQGS